MLRAGKTDVFAELCDNGNASAFFEVYILNCTAIMYNLTITVMARSVCSSCGNFFCICFFFYERT